MNGALHSFPEYSYGVVRKFVQTVIFLDDHAFQLPAAPPVAVQPPPEPAMETESGASAPVSAPASTTEATQSLPAKKQEEAGLDPKRLIEEFAAHGLICSVLEPDTEDLSAIKSAARRADVVVLDWVIHKDHGGRTTQLIRDVLEKDTLSGGRLRLIALYTVEPDLAQIVATIQTRLAPEYEAVIESSGLALRGPHFRVVALGKENAPIPNESPFHENVVTLGRLPERLCKEFASLASGIVSNVALKGLAVLRDNTHAVLARLGRDLDPGYLAHRLLLSTPDDAADDVVDILGSELLSILQSYDVRDEAGDDRLEAWLNERGPNFALPSKTPRTLSRSECLDALKVGLSKWTADNDAPKPEKYFRVLAALFMNSPAAEAVEASNLTYAEVASCVSRYDKKTTAGGETIEPAPRLTQGTIIRQETGGAGFYLCMQPRCDSVRLDDARPRQFILLEATEIADAEGKFDLALKDGTKVVRLRIVDSVFDQRLVRFRSTRGVVRAKYTAQGWIFQAVELTAAQVIEPSATYRWIGQLKDLHAQRVAHRFASGLSRVGVNESEWLRRISDRRGG